MMRSLHLGCLASIAAWSVKTAGTSRALCRRLCSPFSVSGPSLLVLCRSPASAPRACRAFSQLTSRQTNGQRPQRDDQLEKLRAAKPLVDFGKVKRFLKSPILHGVLVLYVVGVATFFYINMQTVLVSGRRRFNCYSSARMSEVGEAQARRIISEVEQTGGRFLPEWDWRTMQAKMVMRRLIPASNMEDENWEIKVIHDLNKVTAFVLPGGKVFVYSGLFQVTRNEHALAAVLGHEMAHNLAQHAAERMSSTLGGDILLYSLFILTAGLAIIPAIWFYSFPLDLVFKRPMGRRQEAEADYIGLMLMAEACYDPREAIGYWQRMEKMTMTQIPEWMSTHPSHGSRIENMRKWMPEALKKQQDSDCNGSAEFAHQFTRALNWPNIVRRQYGM